MGCAMNTRSEVLRLYRRILHVARHWEASPRSDINSAIEQQYIKDEARRLFRRNKEVSIIRRELRCIPAFCVDTAV